ncbi:ATPase, T2SS/T4P/T4SS family [Erythrobacter ani]|uniref:Flp pilus assembly complex ATPase component TadA n=1 Tax=Erythrobacter ani TaxID=2827235 RepID=A0ABS6SKV6_9SPHN|nr:ATPase, T2SS/T4P/T4SS family [Erythrobacter ani]MBV7265157.1 Flp pilus assembly complex ATPase component TadA [Erythrobacter ani]
MARVGPITRHNGRLGQWTLSGLTFWLELRGVEAFTFLRAVNTGHPGSMTTIHADTPQRAIEQLALLVLQAGSKLGRDDVRHYVRESVDVFVQLERRNGRRQVSQILVAQ